MSELSSRITSMSGSDGADRPGRVCDQPGRAFVLGLRGHLAPLPVLVILLFPLSIPSLSVFSSLLFSCDPFIPPSLVRAPSSLPKAMPSCRL